MSALPPPVLTGSGSKGLSQSPLREYPWRFDRTIARALHSGSHTHLGNRTHASRLRVPAYSLHDARLRYDVSARVASLFGDAARPRRSAPQHHTAVVERPHH